MHFLSAYIFLQVLRGQRLGRPLDQTLTRLRVFSSPNRRPFAVLNPAVLILWPGSLLTLSSGRSKHDKTRYVCVASA